MQCSLQNSGITTASVASALVPGGLVLLRRVGFSQACVLEQIVAQGSQMTQAVCGWVDVDSRMSDQLQSPCPRPGDRAGDQWSQIRGLAWSSISHFAESWEPEVVAQDQGQGSHDWRCVCSCPSLSLQLCEPRPAPPRCRGGEVK